MVERRTPRYSEFVQYVRHFAPSKLIPFLAHYSAAHDMLARNGPIDRETLRTSPPWAVAAMARESIVHGNEYRSALPTERDLRQMFYLHSEAHDEDPDPNLARLLTALVYQQFYYQESEFEEVSRSWALLGEDFPDLAPLDWEPVLGLPLDRAMNAVLALHALVVIVGGNVSKEVLDQPRLEEVFRRLASREDFDILIEHLSVTPAAARAAVQSQGPVPAHRARYAFNPLISSPLVHLGQVGTWAPQSALVSRALTPGNLFYAGLACWGGDHARRLGQRTEAYVGRQLRLLAGEALQGEITYHAPNEQKSVDWIWVHPRVVLIVEVKSARMTLGALLNPDKFATLIDDHLQYARTQIDRTAAMIGSSNPAFAHIPTDRPVLGIAVTAEPFYLANSLLPEYGTAAATPSLIVSLRELEQLMTLEPDAAIGHLLKVVHDPRLQTQSLSTTFSETDRQRRNPVLERAWKKFRDVEEATVDGLGREPSPS